MASYDILTPPENFDEQHYLQINPDVADAVRNGTFPSGWYHYLYHGLGENRPGVPHELGHALQLRWYATQEIDLPMVPPARLRARVHGDPTYQSYDEVGVRNARNLEHVIEKFRIEIPDGGRVLDFGCGCGRILRHLAPQHPNWRIFGADIDEEAIRWNRENLTSLASFERNDDWPPTRFSDQGFDLVFAVGIFTHLPEAMQHAWISELARITKPNGWLLLTTQVTSDAHSRRGSELRANGFQFVVAGNTEGLPEYYQLAAMEHEYIRSKWSDRLEVVDILPKFINDHQDLVVCRSRWAPL